MKNRGFCYRETIGADDDGTPLLRYLSRRYLHSSADAWRRRIDRGRVRIEDKPVDADTLLRRGQRLSWDRPPWHEPDAPTAVAVVYRDPHLLVVSKPAGLPTLPGAGFLERTLLHRVRREDPQIVPMHRLGRHTSGLVLCARTPSARSRLAEAWRTGRVVKRYRALAAGRPTAERFAVDQPIGPVPYPPLGTVHAAVDRGGRPARTVVRILEEREESFLAEVEIETGRPHQIRIHLAAIGHPLVGDPLYLPGGRPDPTGRALPGDPGYRLHARELRLPHPEDEKPLTLVAPPPPPLVRSR